MIRKFRHSPLFIKKMSFEKITNYTILYKCGLDCCKGGRWKRLTQTFEMQLIKYTAINRKELLDGTYKPSKTDNFIINERGKERLIKAHKIKDRQVYKAFCKYELEPAVKNLLMYRNFASQKGKGTDFAINTFKQDLVHAYQICGGKDFYVVIFDFHDYFNSIPHKEAYELLAPKLSESSVKPLASAMGI